MIRGMLEKIKKYAIGAGVAGIIFLLLMVYSMYAPEEEEILSPCPDCNVTISCPPCPECPSFNVTVPSADLTVPTFTEAEVENITLNYISNLQDDPRSWFEVKSMTYGDNGNWTVWLQRHIPGSPSSPRTFIIVFNEVTGNVY